MARQIRVGIISANWSVTAHLPAWRASPDVEVVAICTAHRETAEAAANAHKIPGAFWDYRKLGGDARPSFPQGCHVHAVIEAAHKSAQERRWVHPRELR